MKDVKPHVSDDHKKNILEAFGGTITNNRITKAKELLIEIKKRFVKNEKLK